MGIARHEDVLQLICLLQEETKEAFYLFNRTRDACAREEFDVQGHLIVAGTAGVHLLSQGSQTGLYLGVNVFPANGKLAFQSFLAQFLQGRQQLLQLIGL